VLRRPETRGSWETEAGHLTQMRRVRSRNKDLSR
jgi:hypothetical protein